MAGERGMPHLFFLLELHCAHIWEGPCSCPQGPSSRSSQGMLLSLGGIDAWLLQWLEVKVLVFQCMESRKASCPEVPGNIHMVK